MVPATRLAAPVTALPGASRRVFMPSNHFPAASMGAFRVLAVTLEDMTSAGDLWWELLQASSRLQSPVMSLEQLPLHAASHRVEAVGLLDVAADAAHPLWSRFANDDSRIVRDAVSTCSNLPGDVAMQLALHNSMFLGKNLAVNPATPIAVLEVVREQDDFGSYLASNPLWVSHHQPAVSAGMSGADLRRALLDQVRPSDPELFGSNANLVVSAFVRNPQTAPDVLEAIILMFERDLDETGHGEVSPLVRGAAHPALRPERLLPLIDRDSRCAAVVGQHQVLTPELREYMMGSAARGRDAVLQFQPFEDDELDRLLGSCTLSQRRLLARNPHMPPEFLAAMVFDDFSEARRSALYNPSTPPAALLCSDDPLAADAARERGCWEALRSLEVQQLASSRFPAPTDGPILAGAALEVACTLAADGVGTVGDVVDAALLIAG